MKKFLISWLLPMIIDGLSKLLQDWIDDPDTDTDQNAVNAVTDYIKYVADKKLG